MNTIIFLQLFVVIFWIGFVCAISFFESWIKFRAPGITLAVGLRVGKKVYNSLNRVEWVLFLITIILLMLNPREFVLNFIVPGLVLLLQTFYLLPRLTQRADKIIAENTVTPSWHHWGYIMSDVTKIFFLFFLTIQLAEIKW